jgi:hypothetical protein
MDTVKGHVTVHGTSVGWQGGRLRSERSVAGTAVAWHDGDMSQSAGEIVPDRKLSLPRQSEGYSHGLDGNMADDTRFAYDGWLCRWESMTNASAQASPG